MKVFGYIVCILASVVAGIILFETILSADSAPQQAAGAAVACAIAVIPYVFARGLEKIMEK